MLISLIRKEVISHVLSLRFVITFILTLLLGSISFTISATEYDHNIYEYGARERGNRDVLEKILLLEDDGDRRWRIFGQEGKTEPVPVSKMSSVVQGLAPSLPAAINATRSRVTNIDRGIWRNPLLRMNHAPDIVYVVGVVMSLLAILYSFDSISGEKESGTLRLMLSNAVPRHTILLSKWVAGFSVLVTPFVVVYLAGVGYVWARGSLELSGDQAVRLAMLLVMALLYISVFFNLGLFVSCCTHRSTTSLFLCLLIWVALVLAVPNLAPVIAKIMEPAPTIVEIEAEKRAVDDEIRLRMRRIYDLSGGLSYGERVQREQEKLEQEGEDRKKRWDRYLVNATRQQTNLAGLLGRIGPSASWVYAATELTLTGPSVYDRLDGAAKRMRLRMDEMDEEIEKAHRNSNWEQMPEIRLDELPTLNLTYPTLDQSQWVVLNDLLLLSMQIVIFFMLSFALFLRYDVR